MKEWIVLLGHFRAVPRLIKQHNLLAYFRWISGEELQPEVPHVPVMSKVSRNCRLGPSRRKTDANQSWDIPLLWGLFWELELTSLLKNTLLRYPCWELIGRNSEASIRCLLPPDNTVSSSFDITRDVMLHRVQGTFSPRLLPNRVARHLSSERAPVSALLSRSITSLSSARLGASRQAPGRRRTDRGA